jgi:hypothetical protein
MLAFKNYRLLFLVAIIFIVSESFGQSTGIPSTNIQATDGQVMTWNNTLNRWNPATAAIGGTVKSKNGLVTVLDTVKLGGNLTESTVINGQKLYSLSDTSLASYSVNAENATHISNLIVKPASNGGVYGETYQKATPNRKAVLNLNANDDSPPTMIRQTGDAGNCGMYLGINATYMNMSWNNTGGTDYTNLQFDANGVFMNGIDAKTTETSVLHYNTTTKEITFGAAEVVQNVSTNGLTGGAVATVGTTGVEYYGCNATSGAITINTDQTFLATAKVVVKADNNGTNNVTIVDNGTTTMVVSGVNGTTTSYTLDLFELVEIERIGNTIYIKK